MPGGSPWRIPRQDNTGGTPMQRLADYLPAKVRAAIYAVLGTAVALEAVWDIVPEPLEGKVLASLTVLGFGLAVANTPIKES